MTTPPKKSAPPPPEFQAGCDDVDRAAGELARESEQVASKIAEKRRSGRWNPPVYRPARRAGSTP